MRYIPASKKSGLRLLVMLLVMGLVFSLPNPVLGFRKTATTAAAFLLIPVGSRTPSMGGAGVALSSTPEALAFNPASAWSNNTGINVSYADWIAGLRHQSVALTVPYGNDYTLGLHVLSFGGDSFEQTTLEEQEGNGVMVEYGDLAVGVSGVAKLTDRFTAGITGKYIHQKLFHETASTFAFDVGTLLRTDLDGLSIGMSMTNLGGEMQLEGRDLFVDDESGIRYETSKWPLPLCFRTGIGWRLLGKEEAVWNDPRNSFTLAADAFHLNEGFTTLHLGAEYAFGDVIFGRAGHIVGHDTQSWTFGAGVSVMLYSYRLQADYALAELEDLGGIQRISLTLQRRTGR